MSSLSTLAHATHDVARAAAAVGAVGFLTLRRMNARLALLRQAPEEAVPPMNEWFVNHQHARSFW